MKGGARLRVVVVSKLRRRLNQCNEAMLSYSPVPGKDGEVHDVRKTWRKRIASGGPRGLGVQRVETSLATAGRCGVPVPLPGTKMARRRDSPERKCAL